MASFLLPKSQVLKKKILDVVEGDAEEGRKMADMLVSFSLHQVGDNIT